MKYKFIDNDNINTSIQIQVKNLGDGPDSATLIDSNDTQNQMPDLQSPWDRGNIKSEPSGNLLIIANNEVDQNNDGIIDLPLPEESTPAGMLTFQFDSPVYQFGWDVFNVNSTQLKACEITFIDSSGNSVTVPFTAFTTKNLFLYDSSLRLSF